MAASVNICGTILTILLAPAVSASISLAETQPGATLRQAQVIVDEKARPKTIDLEFEVVADFVVNEVELLYRIRPLGKYRRTKLKRDPLLRYIGSVQPGETIEYFLIVKPERGSKLAVGSTESPFKLETSDLKRVPPADTGSRMEAFKRLTWQFLQAFLRIKDAATTASPASPSTAHEIRH